MREQTPTQGMIIPFRLLFGVYAIVPILALIALSDAFFFGHWIRTTLPNTPESFVWYIVLFGLPHIMASFFSFADPEYLRYYKDKLLYRLPIFLVITVLASIYLPIFAILAFVIYTIYHVISQQGGITLMFARGRSSLYEAWKWATIVLASFVYLAIYFPSLVPRQLETGSLFPLLILLMVGIISAISLRIISGIRTTEGRWYFLATAVSFIVSPFFFIFGYAVFAVFTLRFVHDITAFIFYAVHDNNRNREQRTNLIYRYLPTKHIPLVVFTPVLAIALALPISLYAGTIIVYLLGFIHYYTEGFVWKRDTPHRKQMAFESSHAISE